MVKALPGVGATLLMNLVAYSSTSIGSAAEVEVAELPAPMMKAVDAAPQSSNHGEMAPASQIRVSPLPASAHHIATPQVPFILTSIRPDATAESLSAPMGRGVPSVLAPARIPLPRTSTTSFEGLDLVTSADNGWTSGVPDTVVSASHDSVIEMTNKGIRLSTTGGTPVQTLDLNAFFGVPYDALLGFESTLFDPKVHYDHAGGANARFYTVALTFANQEDFVTGISKMHIAISRSAEPASLNPADWCSYTLDTKTEPGSPAAAWSDFPSIGVGKDTVAISTNSYEFTPEGAFRYAEVRAFNKIEAIDNASSCPGLDIFRWTPSSTAGNHKILNLTPAHQETYAPSFKRTKNPLYLMSTEHGEVGEPFGSNKIHVWRVRNMAGGSPTLQGKTISGSWMYSSSPQAEQPFGGPTLKTGAQKVTGLASRGNSLYGVFNSNCDVGVSPPFESCIVFTKVDVGQNSKGKMTVRLRQQFADSYGANTFIWMPSIAVNSNGQAFVTAQASDDDVLFGGLRTIGMRLDPGDAIFQEWFPVTPEGECAIGAVDGTRTGDYTGTALDPNDGTSFWMAGEYSKDLGGLGCWWGTTIVHAAP